MLHPDMSQSNYPTRPNRTYPRRQKKMILEPLDAFLRAKAIRTAEALWKALGDLCDSFSPGECANYFRHNGYFQST